MVFCRATLLQNAHGATGISGSSGQDVREIGLADVVGARAGGQDAAGPQHLQGAQVELFVAPESVGQRGAVLREWGRVKDDGVVLATGRGVVLEQVKGIGLDPFKFPAIKRGILLGHF